MRGKEDALFTIVAPAHARRGGGPWVSSIVAHAAGFALLTLIPILRPEPIPQAPSSSLPPIFFPDFAPPPPAPRPKGAPDGRRMPALLKPDSERAPTPAPLEDVPVEAPVEAVPPDPSPALDAELRRGEQTGSDSGTDEGMKEGVDGGLVGGLPDGLPGGAIGGAGLYPVPVRDFDRPPRLVKPSRPRYPTDAFARKVEGVVIVEFLIDSKGHVLRARVVQSIPLLDAAALEAVREWEFQPAVRRGRTVATTAQAPVTFRIF